MPNPWQRSKDGRLIKTLSEHSDSVLCVTFSPDGDMLASCSYDGTINLYRRDGTLIRTIGSHSQSVNSIDFSPDGQILASGSNDNTVKL